MACGMQLGLLGTVSDTCVRNAAHTFANLQL